MSLSIALNTAVRALQVNQAAIDVTSQNVANVNTEGYSRKIVQQEAVVVAGSGQGVEITAIARRVNEFILKDYRNAISEANASGVENDFYGRMQDLFGSLSSDTSVAAGITDLATAFQAFSATPNDVTLKSEVISRAQSIAQEIQSLAESIQMLRLEADRNIEDSVRDINAKLAQLEDINLRIAQGEALGLGTNDLKDQRDNIINAISAEMDIRYFYRDNGEVVIFTDSGRPLLDRTAQSLSHAAATSFSNTLIFDNGTGGIDTISLNGADITNEIAYGKIAGYVNVRDNVLPDLATQLEDLAQNLHNEINALHNQATSFPGLATLTGTRTVAAGDPPVWTGTVRVAVVDTSGQLVEYQDINLAGQASIGALQATINGFTNATAAISGGNFTISATGGNRIAINEMTSAVTVGGDTMGLSDFLGLNDFFSSSNDYETYTSGYQQTRSTPLGLAGTLTFSGSWGSTAVNYSVGNDLQAVAAAITADATLTAQGISATAVRDGSGYRLRITDAGGQNFFVRETGGGTMLTGLGIEARDSAIASSFNVNSELRNDESRLAHATLSSVATPTIGDVVVSSGDNTKALDLANRFEQQISFASVGGLSSGDRSFGDFAGAIIALNATQAANTSDTDEARQFLFENLRDKTISIAGVNLDEEMANLIVLENAYAASARVITATSEMFDILTTLVAR